MFEAAAIDRPEDIYGLWIPLERNSLQLRWKESMRGVPIFRRSVRTKDGIDTSPYKALTYDTFRKYLANLGRAAGFRLPLTLYCLRRGAANAVNGTLVSRPTLLAIFTNNYRTTRRRKRL